MTEETGYLCRVTHDSYSQTCVVKVGGKITHDQPSYSLILLLVWRPIRATLPGTLLFSLFACLCSQHSLISFLLDNPLGAGLFRKYNDKNTDIQLLPWSTGLNLLPEDELITSYLQKHCM